jgi:hypothetical protein
MQLILSLYILFSAASFAQVVMCKGISDSREVTVEVGESNLSRAMVEVVVHTDGEKFKGQGVQTYNENDTSSISAFLKADQEYQSVELLVDMTIREK